MPGYKQQVPDEQEENPELSSSQQRWTNVISPFVKWGYIGLQGFNAEMFAKSFESLSWEKDGLALFGITLTISASYIDPRLLINSVLHAGTFQTP